MGLEPHPSLHRPPRSCAHNPSGVDPSQQQWQQILAVVLAKKLLPFFDFAYQVRAAAAAATVKDAP